MLSTWPALAMIGFAGVLGCATTDANVEADSAGGGVVVFGRIVAVLMAPSNRTYEPEVRFFEIMNRTNQERVQIDVRSDDKIFVVMLSPGDYEVTRVQIHEGPFASMAEIKLIFQVEPGSLTYLGTWRLGVDSPRQERMVVVSAVQDREDQTEAEHQIVARYPDLAGRPVIAMLPTPASSETRLYEVMPYPRYPTYFRRHW